MTESTPVPQLGFTPGETLIVTGAASGIGHATASLVAAMRLRVAIWDLDEDGAMKLADQIRQAGGEAVGVKVDVSSPDQVETAFEITCAEGPARYLVNNAGPASFAALEFEEALRVSIGSVRLVTDRWMSGWVAPDAAVVNVASIAGTAIATDSDWYTTSKAGIAGYTRYLAGKRSDLLRANAVAPGFVDTPRMRTSGFVDTDTGRAMIDRIPLRRLATPAEVAGVITFLLSPLAAYVNGAVIPIDGGLTVAQ